MKCKLISFTISDFCWKHVFTTKFGTCYTMSIPEEVQSEQILEIELEMTRDAHVYTLFPGQFLSYDTKSQVVAKLGSSYSVEVSFSVSLIRQLLATQL
jgi:hypothetical protein